MRQPRNEARTGPGAPLTSRSVIASTLLGTDPPRLPARVLVRAAELFGIAEGTTRVALSRMATAGELRSAGGSYELSSPALLERHARQQESRAPRTRRWDGGWIVVVVVAERRTATDRKELRDVLRRARLGELREGVWMRPDNLEPTGTSGRLMAEHCTTLRATNVEAGLIERLWDLDGWRSRAEVLRAELRHLTLPLQRGDTEQLADGFVLSASVLRHLQADPLLPGELLADRWPGEALRDDYDRFDAAYRAVLRSWFRTAHPTP